MSLFPRNPAVSMISTAARVPDLLTEIKNEFDALAHEFSIVKAQRDEYERKLQAQITEVQNIQATLFELERNHNKLKQQYEEEIQRLRRQAELAGPLFANGSGAQGGIQGMISNGPGPTSLFPFNTPVAMPSLPGFDKPAQPQAAPPTRGSFSTPSLGSSSPTPPPNKRDSNGGGNFHGSTLPVLNFDPNKKTTDPKEGFLPNLLPPKETPRAEQIEFQQPKPEKTHDKDADWTVTYHQNVQTNFNVDLGATLEHSSVVCCVRFSHDGKYLATGCNRTAQIYDADTGDKIYTFSDDNSKDGDLYIRSVCFSPDGKLLAAGAEDKTVKVWDIEHKRIAHTFSGHEMDIYSLDFTNDGNFIVSGSGDKKAKVWDVEKEQCVFTLGNDEFGPKDGVTSVAISPDGRLIAAGSLDRVVRLWDSQTGYFLERYEGHLDSVYSVAFSPDGRTLASGSLDKTLRLWEVSGRTRARCRAVFQGHRDFVLSVAFSPDGNWLISGSKDRKVQFWDPRTAIGHMVLQGHKNSVISVAVNPRNGSFATGSGDYRARIWKYRACYPMGPN